MSCGLVALLCVSLVLVAMLYSSVGHAGASGYIAVMSLFALAPDVIRPTALTLNVFVASIATWQFWRAGHFSWHVFWPFTVLSVPLAFVGGSVSLPPPAFNIVVGVVLLASAARLLARPPADERTREASRPLALSMGAGLGLLSGLTGTGGGIFLTPLLLLKRWASMPQAAGVTAAFILVNSVAGLGGNLGSTRHLPAFILPLVLSAGAGGAVGSYLGSHRLPTVAIKRLLASVLLIAGVKLIFAR